MKPILLELGYTNRKKGVAPPRNILEEETQ
jgi:hypothetical protein